MEEIWKDIVIEKNGTVFDYTGLYQVSNLGRVRNSRTGKVLKPSNVRGYFNIALQKNKEKTYMSVHRLVALMFIQNDDPTNKTQVNHINENKHDNRVENLEWVTPKENTNHGTGNQRRKEKQINGKGSKRVRCIETNIIYNSTREAQRELKIKGVSNCCRGEQKSCGGYHFEYIDDKD